MNNPAHIMVIDDNEDILFMLQAMLKIKGYKVSIKWNMDDLENTISQLSPDVILMDMLLSGTDGREVCRKLKSDPAFAAIPIIMISAHPEAKTTCIAAGADFFLEKPFEMNEIFEIVANALASR